MHYLYRFLQFIFPNLVFYHSNSSQWSLTIDDSPSPNTLWILDLLDSYNTKANFFCVGKNIETYPNLFNEIVKRGHQLGYHSYFHVNAWHQTNEVFVQDFEKCQGLFESNVYRPPYGKLTWFMYRYLKDKGIKIMLWDVLTEDWKKDIDPLKKIKSKISQAKHGSIIVIHDNGKSYSNLKVMLPYILENMNQNFQR